MKDLQGKVAVVTGAASGIGRATARRLGAEGMKLVVADVEGGALLEMVRDLEKRGIEAKGVVTDVTQADAVQATIVHDQCPIGEAWWHENHEYEFLGNQIGYCN